MAPPWGTDHGEGADSTSFRDALERLKRRGCNLLVVGDVAPEIRTRFVRRYFGQPDDYGRVVCSTVPEYASIEALLPRGISPDLDTVAHVTSVSTDRSAAGTTVVDSHAEWAPSVSSGPGEQKPYELAEAVFTALGEVRANVYHATPGSLRLAVLTLEPLLDTHGATTVTRMCRVIGFEVLRRNAVGFYHLPAAPDDDRVDRIDGVFDGIISLRSDGTNSEQQWDIDGVETTDWIQLL